MKVSVNWLRDYLPIELPAAQLSEKISRTAVEVEGLYQPKGNMKKIVIAKVLSVVPHPDSDHMVITQLDAGEDEPIQVVTGAPNVAEGQTVVLAKHGSVIGDNKKIRKGKLRGEPSNGMLAALQEIGFDDKISPKDFEDGIWVFNDVDATDLKPGEDALKVLGLDDDVLETGITPNRADLFSMNGTAWEVAAILSEEPVLPTFELNEVDEKTSDVISSTAPAELASKYAVRVVKNVTVKDSPLWLQRRLWTMGIRPISNIVDITNYMLLMYGQPMHAFDLNALPAAEVHVRRAADKEQIKTLDGVEREASAEDIVIASGDEALMFAGVMGGESTEVTGQTTDIVLEGAIFDPKSIRHTARDQNLHSEASMRFERGVNVADTFTALDHAAVLVAELAGGQVTSGRVVAQDFAYEAPVVSVSVAYVNHVLGTTITSDEIAAIFDRLFFEYEVNDDVFSVTVPARRWDITIAADLIEEIARLYGYDNLPTTLPTGDTTPGKLTAQQRLVRASRHVLEGLGLNQAISYVLTTPEKANRFALHDGQPVQLDYPMSQDRQQTRSSLLTSLLDDVAYNKARKQTDVALYEQGRVFVSDGDLTKQPQEIEHLAGVITGNVAERTWAEQAQAADFYTIKGIVEQLLTNYGFADDVAFVVNTVREDMHPGRTADIYVGNVLIGFVGQIHPLTAKEYRINETFAFELNLTAIIELTKVTGRYEAISRYPAVSRDLAILVNRDIPAAQIELAIKQAGGKHLHDIVIFDVYTGENVPSDMKSIAVGLTFVNAEQTMLDDETSQKVDHIASALAEQFGAEIR
ncbi:phenylalanine--tRNA ligase subunit beta [Weissella hellenica]|uniref:Phenylalanine--tRNA ligase beta subunit n=1 Tax=Weissella hellenica TaxID=46256 RepID=A0A4Y4G226_WEIHE|nr:phenylalanine--tRNA ligase subunit beta [Weissella hellenica]NKY66915.1 phenylalanine--tRNA ligase subunit beta [Weissella hellenica]GED35847.1 phenylalanine--tRNA ligase beta subunit [Weissella hellenica]SCB87850.1 phenylalanyl-tRNA synthetase beta subunit [Weissella hellenica]